jgi:hypothetical protein
MSDPRQDILELASEYAIVYSDGTIEFDEESLLRFVEVLRTEVAADLYPQRGVIPDEEEDGSNDPR